MRSTSEVDVMGVASGDSSMSTVTVDVMGVCSRRRGWEMLTVDFTAPSRIASFTVDIDILIFGVHET